MERMTIKCKDGVVRLSANVTADIAVDRLAAYEDAGLEPDKVAIIAKSYPKLLDVAEELQAYRETGLDPSEIKEAIGWMSPVCVGCEGKTEEGARTAECGYPDSFKKCLEQSAHLSELLNAEQEGRLVMLPCKAGDTVYQLRDKKHALGIGVHPRHISRVCVYGDDWYADHQGEKPCMRKDLGKTWFLTREAAEAALRGSE